MSIINLLVSTGVVDTPSSEEHRPSSQPLLSTEEYLLIFIIVAVVVIAFCVLTWYCKRLKQKNKLLQAELEEVKKQQANADYNSSNPESTKEN